MKLPEERLEMKGGMGGGGPVLREGVGGCGPAAIEGEAGGGPVIEETEAVKKLLGQLLT